MSKSSRINGIPSKENESYRVTHRNNSAYVFETLCNHIFITYKLRLTVPVMTRGNQRDEARLKNAKDAAGKGVKKDGSYLLRKEADSNALAEKVVVAASF